MRSFLCFFESSCRWPNLSSAPHLQDNFIQRSPRWAKHYIRHSCVKSSLLAASFETSTRGVEIHGTPHVIPAIVSPRRTSPTIGGLRESIERIAQSFGDTEERVEALKRDAGDWGSPRGNVAVR